MAGRRPPVTERRRISSGGPWESVAGYSRAIVVGGFDLSDVVRTRMFVTDIARSAEVSAVHGAVFGAIRPAATLVEVSALMEPSLLVEIEAEARRG